MSETQSDPPQTESKPFTVNNEECPITLEKIDPEDLTKRYFIFTVKPTNSVRYAYNPFALRNYLASTNVWDDPSTKIPYSEEDLNAIDGICRDLAPDRVVTDSSVSLACDTSFLGDNLIDIKFFLQAHNILIDECLNLIKELIKTNVLILLMTHQSSPAFQNVCTAVMDLITLNKTFGISFLTDLLSDIGQRERENNTHFCQVLIKRLIDVSLLSPLFGSCTKMELTLHKYFGSELFRLHSFIIEFASSNS